MRPLSASVGPNAAAGATSRLMRFDEWADSPISIQAVTEGTINYSIQHSHDDPNDLINPVPLADMWWDSGLFPAAAANTSANISFGILTAPLWIRLLVNSGTGSVRVTVVQYNTYE